MVRFKEIFNEMRTDGGEKVTLRSQNNNKKQKNFDKLTLLSLPKEEMRSAHSLEDSKFRSAFSMTPS